MSHGSWSKKIWGTVMIYEALTDKYFCSPIYQALSPYFETLCFTCYIKIKCQTLEGIWIDPLEKNIVISLGNQLKFADKSIKVFKYFQ